MEKWDELTHAYKCIGKVEAYREMLDWWSAKLRGLPDNETRRATCPELIQDFLNGLVKRMTVELAEAKTMESVHATR